MSENEKKIEGFIFTDIEDYNEANREAESIEYIRANNDLEDYNKIVKLYYKLVEQKTLRTAVGLAFLMELQERILNEGIISKANLPCIKIEKDAANRKTLFKTETDQSKNNPEVIANYRIKLRNSRIISLFLLIIIIVMIFIAIFSDRSVYTNYENKILNKYSAWEEDLNIREKALQEKEDLQSVD